jgi:hypothetical protein
LAHPFRWLVPASEADRQESGPPVLPNHPGLPLGLLVLGLSVAVGLPLAWRATRPPPNVGVVPAARAVPRRAEGEQPRQPVGRLPGPIAVHSARLADQQAPPVGPVPVHLRIPALSVDSTVVPVGVDAVSGGVQVPGDVQVIGWYRFGPAPGQPGPAVLVGHVDSAQSGPGAFFRLGTLAPGAVVRVLLSDGSMPSFRVVARRRYPKGRLPTSLFSEGGTPRLVLITCGGPFDRVSHHYQDNVVVYAIPAG